MKRVIRSLSTVALMLGLNPGIAAAGDGVPRTASGRPDLTGSYNAATVTPLQRPERFGDNLYLSKEEAERVEGNMAARIEETSQASDPDREAPPEGGDGSDGGAGNVGGYNFFWLDPGTEAFAVDGRFRTSILIDPPNGRFPPMTESAAKRKAAYEANIVRGDNDGTAFWLDSDEPGPFDGPESLLAQERCIVGFTGATPTLPSGYNNYKTIVQTEDHVMILIEMVHDARVVRMKSEGRAVAHLPSEIKKWAGDSIGWWEGDTLVVDTTNFHPEAFLRGGSTEMHVVERFAKLEDGDVLYRFTVDDPSSWTAPWTGEYVLRSTTDRVFEYACHEGNYAMGNILRGARVLEADALGKVVSSRD